MADRRLREELLETVRDPHAAGAVDVRKMQEFETFRVVQAPAPFVPPSVPLPPTCVVSVLSRPGESVEWTWTHDANGARHVTGYTIIGPRRTTKSRPATQ